MPTYSYECKACGHTYDAFQSISDEPDTQCPQCKGKVERLIGAGAGIVFKGSGFYVTDYKKSGSSASSSTSPGSSATPPSTPSTGGSSS